MRGLTSPDKMSNITNKTSKIKNIFFILFIFLIGCSTSRKYKIEFYTDEEKISIESFLYEYEEALYIKLNETEKKTLENITVKKIEILVNGKLYNALPVKIAFSKKNVSSDFIFPIENRTNYIIIEKFNNKNYVPMISEKTSIKEIIEDNIIKPKPLTPAPARLQPVVFVVCGLLPISRLIKKYYFKI